MSLGAILGIIGTGLGIMGYMTAVLKFALDTKNEVRNITAALAALAKEQQVDREAFNTMVAEVRKELREDLGHLAERLEKALEKAQDNRAQTQVAESRIGEIERRVEVVERKLSGGNHGERSR